jgi:hypothetical protein
VSSFPKSTYRILSGIAHREARFGISSMQCGIRTLRQKADLRSPLYQESRGRAVPKLVFKVQIEVELLISKWSKLDANPCRGFWFLTSLFNIISKISFPANSRMALNNRKYAALPDLVGSFYATRRLLG